MATIPALEASGGVLDDALRSDYGDGAIGDRMMIAAAAHVMACVLDLFSARTLRKTSTARMWRTS
jgi:hypothetical protein